MLWRKGSELQHLEMNGPKSLLSEGRERLMVVDKLDVDKDAKQENVVSVGKISGRSRQE